MANAMIYGQQSSLEQVQINITNNVNDCMINNKSQRNRNSYLIFKNILYFLDVLEHISQIFQNYLNFLFAIEY